MTRRRRERDDWAVLAILASVPNLRVSYATLRRLTGWRVYRLNAAVGRVVLTERADLGDDNWLRITRVGRNCIATEAAALR